MPFNYLLNVVMLSRLIYGFKDEPVTKGKLFAAFAFQIILSLVFEFSEKLVFLLIFLIILNVFFYFLERIKKIALVRLLYLICAFLALGLFSNILVPDNFSRSVLDFINWSQGKSLILQQVGQLDWNKSNLLMTGILLLVNEMNFGIRYFFEVFNLAPGENNKAMNEKEYNTGRIIGMLERILIFFFVLSDQFAAIGFIIAAKGFTRYKDLDNRDFAEYVLVGTLLSALCAIIVAVIIKSLIS